MRLAIRTLCLLVVALAVGVGTSGLTEEPAGDATGRMPRVLVVVGAAGTDEFAAQFQTWAERWRFAAKRAGVPVTVIGMEMNNATSDREEFEQSLASHRGQPHGPLWLVFLGHGTYDGKTARFNLRGPDVSASELAAWLHHVESPVAVINCASSSGPFLNALSGKDRVLVTATRSGHEYNFARFGEFFSAALNSPDADLDKDEQVSLLEAFLAADKGVREFYKSEARLATEHALLDDNADKLGTPADWFRGLRAVKAAKAGAMVDGAHAARWVLVPSRHEEKLSAQVRQRRDDLERQLEAFRQRRATLGDDEYLKLIEPILLDLAKLYEGE